jgi:hypothetical protein
MRNSLSLLVVAGCSLACMTVSAQITAQDYDTPSYVQFSAPRYEVSESETNAVVTIVRSGDYRKTASVDYSTQEDTAEENVDFQPCGGTIVFKAGESFRTISIPILRSSEPTPKAFQVQLAQADPYTIVTTPAAEVEIKPQPPALTITPKNGALLVSWPDSGSAYVLDAQVDRTWSPVATPPTLENGTWSVAIDLNAPMALFRLRLENRPQ